MRNAKFVNEQSHQAITFMGNCVVELFGLDTDASYQHCFVYVRQLALHLRNAMIKKTKEALQAIFNWQYLHCLRVWAQVIAEYPGETQLKALVFPLTQVITGVMKLALSPRLIPFRLHCVVLLHRLAASSETFIPTASYLLDILQSPDIHKKPKHATDTPPILSDIIRFPDSGVSTKVQQDAVFQLTMDTLQQAADLYRYNVAFPEYAAPVISALNKLGKESKVGRWRSIARGLAETLQRQASWVSEQRGALAATPQSLQRLETFLPAGTPSAKKRFEKSIAEATAERAAQFANGDTGGTKPRPRVDKKKQNGNSRAADNESSKAAPAPSKKKKKGSSDPQTASMSSKSSSSSNRSAAVGGGKNFEDVVTTGFSWDSDDD